MSASSIFKVDVNKFPQPGFEPFVIALIQLGDTKHDKKHNLSHAREMIIRAAGGDDGKHRDPRLIVLPECFNSPYGVEHFDKFAEVIDYKPGEPYDISKSPSESVKMLSAIAQEVDRWIVGGSIPERDPTDSKKLYNTCTVYNPKGELVALHRKVHMFDISIPGKITFRESDSLTGGNTLTHFETEFAKFGIGICYDVRFPEMAMIAARQGAHMMIYPGAFNMATGPIHWELLQRARAVDNQIFVAMCSPARDTKAGYTAWGHSMVVDPTGHVLSTTEEKEDIVFADISYQGWFGARQAIPVTEQRRFDVYPDISQAAMAK